MGFPLHCEQSRSLQRHLKPLRVRVSFRNSMLRCGELSFDDGKCKAFLSAFRRERVQPSSNGLECMVCRVKNELVDAKHHVRSFRVLGSKAAQCTCQIGALTYIEQSCSRL